MLKLSSALLALAFGCALTLALIYQKTAPLIEKQRELKLKRSLKAVLKADSYKKHEGPPVYFEALAEDGRILGWCLEMVTRGYGGKIYFLVGVNSQTRITGIKILEHRETPGLGSKISEIEYKQTEALFLMQFKNKSIEDLVLVKKKTDKNIQAITGATISSKALVDGVREGVKNFRQEMDKK